MNTLWKNLLLALVGIVVFGGGSFAAEASDHKDKTGQEIRSKKKVMILEVPSPAVDPVRVLAFRQRAKEVETRTIQEFQTLLRAQDRQIGELTERCDTLYATLHDVVAPVGGIIAFCDDLFAAPPRANLQTAEDVRKLAVEWELRGCMQNMLDRMESCRIRMGKEDSDVRHRPFHLKSDVIDRVDIMVSRFKASNPKFAEIQFTQSASFSSPYFRGIEPNNIVLKGDPVILDAAIHNLLSNAFKFTAHESVENFRMVEFSITDTLKPSDYEKPLPPVRDGWVLVEFTVKDSGIGIAWAELEKIEESESGSQSLFQASFQIDPSLNQSGGGSGFGLYSIRKNATRYGGDVGIFSEGAGKGTTLRFYIPLEVVKSS